ncbi:hypothetical protein LV457_06505 [Mycobacterium sp. MYCO198283]|uniref:hypothetical protein n=1 Tax=Mycobacterium sp. MYCO198283 TaxID=2883505 RepID=UPI001E35BE44|nr:hypothetical protein [Mycobacterium sp. MYCO198283]MCG5431940.1 hypothetical protein [Mycobacterium sp. MYCO198283]
MRSIRLDASEKFEEYLMTALVNEWATGLRSATATSTDDAVASLRWARTHATRLVSASMRRANGVVLQQRFTHRPPADRPPLPIIDKELTRC